MTIHEQAADPPLAGRRVRLRPISARDYDYLFDLITHDTIVHRLPYQPGSINPESLSHFLWRYVLAQFVVEHRATKRPFGLVAAYRANLRGRNAYLSVVTDPRVHHCGWNLEGVVLFLNYVFLEFDLRKLYIEIPGHAVTSIASGIGRWLHEEGRLRDHVLHGGRYWDLHVLALHRKDFTRGFNLVPRLAAQAHS